ncbi:hypothetical protein Glove_275g25 [Diversispora epigaea]|uniref:Uncharacterized protein n=1 Tax=Diversispora epigaea TaxID=1348612 RepID=A0A397I379_9GLOM|nr:hypothetical protein Glove_275g25 [Diversispora epigaea]
MPRWASLLEFFQMNWRKTIRANCSDRDDNQIFHDSECPENETCMSFRSDLEVLFAICVDENFIKTFDNSENKGVLTYEFVGGGAIGLVTVHSTSMISPNNRFWLTNSSSQLKIMGGNQNPDVDLISTCEQFNKDFKINNKIDIDIFCNEVIFRYILKYYYQKSQIKPLLSQLHTNKLEQVADYHSTYIVLDLIWIPKANKAGIRVEDSKLPIQCLSALLLYLLQGEK